MLVATECTSTREGSHPEPVGQCPSLSSGRERAGGRPKAESRGGRGRLQGQLREGTGSAQSFPHCVDEERKEQIRTWFCKQSRARGSFSPSTVSRAANAHICLVGSPGAGTYRSLPSSPRERDGRPGPRRLRQPSSVGEHSQGRCQARPRPASRTAKRPARLRPPGLRSATPRKWGKEAERPVEETNTGGKRWAEDWKDTVTWC